MAPAAASTEYPRGTPRRGRDAPPRNIHVAPAAGPRHASTEYPRGTRGGAATRLHGTSTWHPPRRGSTEHPRGFPRRGRGAPPRSIHVAPAAASTEYPRGTTRRGRDAHPRSIHVAPAAAPRRGLHGMSTWLPTAGPRRGSADVAKPGSTSIGRREAGVEKDVAAPGTVSFHAEESYASALSNQAVARNGWPSRRSRRPRAQNVRAAASLSAAGRSNSSRSSVRSRPRQPVHLRKAQVRFSTIFAASARWRRRLQGRSSQ